MIKRLFIVYAVFTLLSNNIKSYAQAAVREKTAFQIAAPWNAAYDVRSDVAIVYGVNDAGGNFEERVKGWRDKGYQVHFMTGIAWGQYKDYFKGLYDGKQHFDEGQKQRNGDTIWHGKDVPYIVPSEDYLGYMKAQMKRVVDAGVTAIYLEEPEFWARAGYSEAFKREWQHYYGAPWRPQHESPEATYLSSKLKYHLYFNALKEVFGFIKQYAKSEGRNVRCYVPTHSLLNYSSWQIVSPEASLATIKDMDGYIAQVWTGTSREPVYYNGIKKERVFENAFLEYGSMVSMTAPTGKKMFFLTDPIEDWPRTWDDYKRNYQATFTAQLLYPTVANYEVMPWPNRIYLGKFKLENDTARYPISKEYATQMQIMVNALNEMPASSNKLNGSSGIGVLVSNSMMFQRFPTHQGYEDPQLSNFYGMVMPLLKNGVPVETVHMENLKNANTLKNIRVLVMSYANMKPLSVNYHKALAQWVQQGGVLLYYGRDDDPFQSVKEWWNSNGLNFKAPSAELFRTLNVATAGDFVKSGKGWVCINRIDPKELVLTAGKDGAYLNEVAKAYKQYAKAGPLQTKNNFLLKRGPYIIAAVLDENKDAHPLLIPGPVVDLFNPGLPVVATKTIAPGEQAFLYDLRAIPPGQPRIVAAAGRAYDEKYQNKQYRFLLKSPSHTVNSIRIYLPRKPKEVHLQLDGVKIDALKEQWDASSKTLLLQFENYSEGVSVSIDLNG
ncbi:hypothetical protein [Niabella soli]|uniref:Beta-galactosidase trimerisation domain-containing protein n=1 Tax=Niabella soli DSM 19437 TaxID=929713 RepID=W0ETD7_9BACT|nr:hypothetical protein [Niabella soli]AHF14085.1 hypothetical protein NIASO_00495 [Niabella soli DSM 19437]